MKKTVFALLLSLALLLSGCHGSRKQGNFVLPESFDTSRDYTITFWAKNDTNMTQVDIYKKAIEDFQALYPNITVNLRLYTDYGKIYNDVITNISTDTTPNVCITYPDHIATYLTGQDAVVPLDGLMGHPKYGLSGSELRYPGAGQIIPEFLQECSFAGSHYAVPFMRSTEACYVNKTYVEQLGFQLPEVLTWDFVWQVSEAAMEKDGEGNFKLNGQKVLIPFIYKSTDNMMIQMLRQLDAPYTTARGDVGLFGPETAQVLETIAGHVETGAFNTFKLAGYPANFLNAGQCIFAIDSTAGATWMGSQAPLVDIAPEKVVDFETAVLPIPQFDPKHPQMISQGPSLCVFQKEDSQEVLASWLFTQFLLTNEVQIAYSQTEGYVPVTKQAQENPAYQDYLSRGGEDDGLHYGVKIDAAKLLLANTQNTFVTPVFNGSASVRSAAGHLIESVNKSVRRKQAVDEAYIQALYDQTASLYHLDQIAMSEGKAELGPLPAGSRWLLAGLGLCWLGMAGVWLAGRKKKKS